MMCFFGKYSLKENKKAIILLLESLEDDCDAIFIDGKACFFKILMFTGMCVWASYYIRT